MKMNSEEQVTEVLDQSNNQSLKSEDDALWGFFDIDDAKARCAVCNHVVSSDRSEMTKHLKKDHPSLVSHIEQDADEESEDSDKCEDPFTQVVYLEQEFAEEEEEPLARVKVKPQVMVQPKLLERRRRMSPYSKEYSIPKRTKPEVVPSDDEDELSIFLKYIKVLLQKLPQEVFGKVQIEIVNLIINAKAKHSEKLLMDNSNANTSYVELQKNRAGNVVTVNDVVASKDMANTTYTITLAPCTSKGADDTNSNVTVVAGSKEN